MFENPRRGKQARNFTKAVPKILDLKSSSEQIFSEKVTLGAPDFLLPSHTLKKIQSTPEIFRTEAFNSVFCHFLKT